VAVNTLRLVVILALLAACDTPSDLPHLQDQAHAVAKDYERRLDELARRVERIRRRGSALPAEVLSTGNIGRVFRHAVSVIDEYRRTLQQVPGVIQGDVKAGDPRKLQQRIASIRERFGHAVTEATSELGAVESALAIAEREGPPQVPPDDPDAAPIR
jgi:DNA-binding IclR family transcriptional regulator